MSRSTYVGICEMHEAKAMEVIQLAPSGCGVTSVLNVLVILGVIAPADISKVDWSSCILRTRANDAPLAQYLASRSVAGCTGAELVASMTSIIAKNSHLSPVGGQFFPFNEMVIELGDGTTKQDPFGFIVQCLKQGKAVIGTFNLQLDGNDAWHHQLIFGADTALRVVFCTNPLCIYSEDQIVAYMSTPSVLVVRRDDVVSRLRFISSTSAPGLLQPPDMSKLDRFHPSFASKLDRGFDTEADIFQDLRWKTMRVVDQIDRAIVDPSQTHIVIPANYIGGVAVFEKLTLTMENNDSTTVEDTVVAEETSIFLKPLFCDSNAIHPNRYAFGDKEWLTIHTRRNLDRVQLNPVATSDSIDGLEYIGVTGAGLFADDVWPGSRVIADYLQVHPEIVHGKNVLELGAGAALPSLVASKLGARACLVTDYPIESVIDNIQTVFTENGIDSKILDAAVGNEVKSSSEGESVGNVLVAGLRWGDLPSFTELTKQLVIHMDLTDVSSADRSLPQNYFNLFHVVLIAEPLWKDTYCQHESLLSTLHSALHRTNGLALIGFAHRPTVGHTPNHDLEFFELARSKFGFDVEFIETTDRYFDVDDDSAGTVDVFLYALRCSDNAL